MIPWPRFDYISYEQHLVPATLLHSKLFCLPLSAPRSHAMGESSGWAVTLDHPPSQNTRRTQFPNKWGDWSGMSNWAFTVMASCGWPAWEAAVLCIVSSCSDDSSIASGLYCVLYILTGTLKKSSSYLSVTLREKRQDQCVDGSFLRDFFLSLRYIFSNIPLVWNHRLKDLNLRGRVSFCCVCD